MSLAEMIRPRRISIALLLIVAFSAVNAFASAGKLDLSFHPPDGFAVYSRQVQDDMLGEQMTRDVQGRLLVLGRNLVYRLLPDGSWDTSFGQNGIATLYPAVESRGAYGIAVQGDGKIYVLAGDVVGAYTVICLFRLNNDGSLDAAFGSGGRRVLDDPWDGEMAVQADGKIIYRLSLPSGGEIVRLNFDGSPDPSFGVGGVFTTPTPEGILGIEPTPDGKILVLSTSGLLRLTASGSVDPAFQPPDMEVGWIPLRHSIAVSPAGIALAYRWWNGQPPLHLTVIRMDDNGSLEQSFGIGGKEQLDIPRLQTSFAGIRLLDDGRVVLAETELVSGSTDLSGADNYDGFVRRLNADGSPDPTFADNGLFEWDRGPDDAFLRLLLLPDGSLRIAGGLRAWCWGGWNPFVLALDAQGAPIPSFGNAGMVVMGEGREIDASIYSNGLAVAPDGRVTVAMSVLSPWSSGFILQRYTSEGFPDTSFGTEGEVDLSGDGFNHIPRAGVLRYPDGRTAVIDNLDDCDSRFSILVRRLNADGSPDTSFGAGGSFRFSGTPDAFSNAAILDSEGRIVIGGRFGDYRTGDYALLVLRLTADGALDPSFAAGGIYIRKWQKSNAALALAGLSNGGLLVAGAIGPQIAWERGIILKLDGTGLPAPSFGSQGVVIAEPGEAPSFDSVALQGEGMFIVAGPGFVSRHLPDGAIDLSFANHGYRRFPEFYDSPPANMVIDARRRIYMAITEDRRGADSTEYSRLVRLLPGGAIDRDFAEEGSFTFSGKERHRIFMGPVTLDGRGRAVVWASYFRLGPTERESKGLLFRLTESPGIRLLAPGGGEALHAGDDFTITWKGYERANRFDTVRVSFSPDSGKNWTRLGRIPAAVRLLHWRVPSVDSLDPKCRIRLELLNARGKVVDTDGNDKLFTIIP